MKRSRRILSFIAAGLFTLALVWSAGCEQIIGLDGPYEAATPEPTGDCMEGATEECYSGDPALKGIGACQPGTRSCVGGSWSTCMGEGSPSIERCAGSDDDCNGSAACSGDFGWALSFGGAGTDSATGIATDAESNIVVGGSFTGTATFGGVALASKGNSDIVVFKLDPTGNPLWSKSFGSSSADNTRAIGVDAAGNILVVGAAAAVIDFGGGPLPAGGTALVVAKLDPNGQHIWSKSFTGAMTLTAVDAAVDPSGNIVISAAISGSVDFGSGLQTAQEESLALVKLDSSGNSVFSKLFGAATMCCGSVRSAVATDAQGNIGLAGTITGKITLGASMFTSTNAAVFVTKLSPQGEVLWAQQGKSAADCAVDGAAFDRNTGDLVISGTFPTPSLTFGMTAIAGATGNDSYVAKFDASGNYLWGKAFGVGGNDENGSEVEVDAGGNISFTGRTNSNTLDLGVGNVGPAGLYVIKMDASGKLIWAKQSDVASSPYPDAAINVDKDGYTLLARGFAAPFSFGGTNLPSLGANDLFVIKLGP